MITSAKGLYLGTIAGRPLGAMNTARKEEEKDPAES
jgi:hypothetical protein